MAYITNPTLFSTHFGVHDTDLENAGLIDPFLDVDTQLFIDPVLLEKSTNLIIKRDAITTFRNHFQNFIRLLSISKTEGDAAWKGARNLLNLDEPPENGLGYGGSGRSGNSRPNEVRIAIMRTSKEIIELGSNDPEMVSFMGFFEEDVGPDTISDFTTRVIIEHLAQITHEFCINNKIPVFDNDITEKFKLPKFLKKNGNDCFIVLVPRDIVRDLPIANDWSDIEKAAFENNRIRQRVNLMLAAVSKPTIADRKKALRSVALEDANSFDDFIKTVKEHVKTYDTNEDALAYYKGSSIFA